MVLWNLSDSENRKGKHKPHSEMQMFVLLNSQLHQVINSRPQPRMWPRRGKNFSCQDNDAAEDGN